MIQLVSNHINVKHITAPPSKSEAQRVLLAAALSPSSTHIKHIGKSDDVNNMLEICRQLGANIEHIDDDTILIIGKFKPSKNELNVGESGLGIRLITTVAATFNQTFTINGKGSLLHRPLHQFKNFLPQMGVNVKFTNEHLPITISGQLKGGNYTVDGSLSSQYISGLLMALPLAKTNSILKVNSPTSTPYIDLTLDVLKAFNIKIEHQNYTTFTIKGRQNYLTQKSIYNIEGDWSGASFWIVYGLITGKISIENLNANSLQADKAILEVVKMVGGNYNWIKNTLSITSNTLKSFNFDATHCPDLFPPLVTLAAAIKGTSTIKGVNRLIYKESNRAKVLQAEFNKLGLSITIDNDLMTIKGTGQLKSGHTNSNNDHRIAMSLAIASVLTPQGLKINQPNCVNKSYPNFWNLFE